MSYEEDNDNTDLKKKLYSDDVDPTYDQTNKQNEYNQSELREEKDSNPSKKKKYIIIGIIVFIIALALILGLTLGLKGNNNGLRGDLIASRKFQVNDAFEYEKKTNNCFETIDFVSKNTTYCEITTSLVSFHVLNIKSSNDIFPNDNEFNIYTLLVLLRNLTVTNLTDTVILGGANINFEEKENLMKNIVFLRGRNLQTNNFTINNDSNLIITDEMLQEFPMFKVDIFDNGTIWKIFKPKNITNKESIQLIETIKDFSPTLAKKLYDSSREPRKINSFIESNSNQSSDNYQEEFGNIIVDPDFSSESESNNKLVLKKNINKDNFLDMSLPDNSNYSLKSISIINKDTGHLQSVISNCSSFFKQDSIEENYDPEPEDPNYFAGEKSKKTDYSKENKIPNAYSRSFTINSSSVFNLNSFKEDEKTSIEGLNYLANRINFDEIQFKINNNSNNKSNFSLNSLFFEKKRKTRILEMNINTINDFKNKEITYPLSQTDFWGFKLNVEMFLKWKPNQNSLSYDFYLYEERTGFFIDLCKNKIDIQLSDTNKQMVNFLYQSYVQIKDLADEIQTLFKSKLFSNVTALLTKIDESIDFPFNIPEIFNNVFSKVHPELINKIKDFLDKTNDFIKQDSEKIFLNPLGEYSDEFENKVLDDVKQYLNSYNSESINKFEIDLISSLEILKQNINNSTSLFPDIINDLDFLKKFLIQSLGGMSQKLKDKTSLDFSEELDSIINSLKSQMSKSYSSYSDAVKFSGYSNGLQNSLEFISYKSDESLNSLEKLSFNLNKDFNNKISSVLGQDFLISESLSLNASNKITNIINDLEILSKNKTELNNELIAIEKQATNWRLILQEFEDFRYSNFNKLFDIPQILNETISDSMEYLNNFYDKYGVIEEKLGKFLGILRTRIDKIVYFGTEKIKDFEIKIKNLLNEDKGELKSLYIQILNPILEPLMVSIINFFNTNLASFETLFQKTLMTAEMTMKTKGNKIVFCNEERNEINSIQGLIETYIAKLEEQIHQGLQTYLLSFQEKIINSLRIPELTQAAKDFYLLNKIVVGEEDLFNSGEISLDLVNSLYVLFNNTRNSIENQHKNNLTKEFDKFKFSLNSRISSVYDQSLLKFADHYSCGSRPLAPSNPIPNTFCIIYSITLAEISATPIATPPQPLSSYCALSDEFKELMTTISAKNIYYPIISPKLDILVNSQISKFDKQSNSLLNSITQASNQIKSAQTENFREIEDIIVQLTDIEKGGLRDYFFKKVNIIAQMLSDHGNKALKLLIEKYGVSIKKIEDFVNSNSEISDFIVSDLIKLVNTIKNDGDYFVQYFQKQVYGRFSGALDKLTILHKQNNQIAQNIFNLVFVGLLIPKAMETRINEYLNNFNNSLNEIFKNATDIRNMLLTQINMVLTIHYQDYQYDFSNLIGKLNIIASQATAKKENIKINPKKSFQLNSYEQLLNIPYISDLAQVPLINFDESLVFSTQEISNLLIDKSFDLFSSRFNNFHSILNNSDLILNNLIRSEVKQIFNDALDNIGNFFNFDTILKTKFQNLAIDFNKVAKIGLQEFVAKFENDIVQWQNTMIQKTLELLNLDKYCVHDKILKQYEKFQKYILSKLTTIYTENLPELQNIFYSTISNLKVLVKGTIYNSTLSSLFNLTNGIPTMLTSNNGESITLLDLITDFKDQYKVKMNNAINLALINIYNDSSSLLEELTTTLETVLEKTQTNILKQLTDISEKMTIYNERYDSDSNGIDFGNFSQEIPIQEGHFTVYYFNFLVNQTKQFEFILSKLDLKHITQLDSFYNLNNYLDVNFQIEVMNNNLQIVNMLLVNKISDYNESAYRLNYDWEAKLLDKLLNNGLNSLIEPLRNLIFSSEAVNNLRDTVSIFSLNVLQTAKDLYSSTGDYIKTLSNNTSAASLEILINFEFNRQLFINEFPKIFIEKINNFGNGLNKQTIDFMNKVEEYFLKRLDSVNLNQFDNELEKKTLSSRISELKIAAPFPEFFDTLKKNKINDLEIDIKGPFLASVTTNLNTIIIDLNKNLDSVNAALRALLVSDLPRYDSVHKIYQILIESIQKSKNFSPPKFTISNNITNKISNITTNFKVKVLKSIKDFQNLLNPLEQKITESLDNLEKIINNDNLQPIIKTKVNPPVQSLPFQLQKICEDLLSQIKSMIYQITHPSSPNRLLNQISLSPPIEISGLQDITNLFAHSLSNAINLINNLPIVQDIEDSVHKFGVSLDQNIYMISKSLHDPLESFHHLVDPKGVSHIKDSILQRVTDINNFARNAISEAYSEISKSIQKFNAFDWEVIETDVVKYLYESRDNLTTKLLNDLEPKLKSFQPDSCKLDHRFPLKLPIPGADVLDFGFALTGSIFFNFEARVDKHQKSILISLFPGTSINLDGTSQLSLMSSEYSAFIRGTLVQAMLTFKAEYWFTEMRAFQNLCLNLDFGELVVGVDARYRNCRYYNVFFFRLFGPRCSSWNTYQRIYNLKLTPLLQYFGCLNLKSRE